MRNEAGKVMKWIDPTIELVACGSSNLNMPTFGHWERHGAGGVLRHHRLCVPAPAITATRTNDTPEFLARSIHMDRRSSRAVVAICDAAQARRAQQEADQPLLRRVERVVSFSMVTDQGRTIDSRVWDEAPPLLEDIYNFEDALLVRQHADYAACATRIV